MAFKQKHRFKRAGAKSRSKKSPFKLGNTIRKEAVIRQKANTNTAIPSSTVPAVGTSPRPNDGKNKRPGRRMKKKCNNI